MHVEDAFKLLAYIERHCGGEDSHAFWASDGGPDILAARAFAERMRAQLCGFLSDCLEVEQRVNVVLVRSISGKEACAA